MGINGIINNSSDPLPFWADACRVEWNIFLFTLEYIYFLRGPEWNDCLLDINYLKRERVVIELRDFVYKFRANLKWKKRIIYKKSWSVKSKIKWIEAIKG